MAFIEEIDVAITYLCCDGPKKMWCGMYERNGITGVVWAVIVGVKEQSSRGLMLVSSPERGREIFRGLYVTCNVYKLLVHSVHWWR